MRARERRFRPTPQPRSGAPDLPTPVRPGSGLWAVHLVTVWGLLLAMAAPLLSLGSVSAAPAAPTRASTLTLARKPGTPPPLLAPSQFVVRGDFPEGDIPLERAEGAVFSAVVPITPGTYQVTFEVQTGLGVVVIGEDGLEITESQPIRLEVPEGALGVYFAIDAWTGEVRAIPLLHQVELVTDAGQITMLPLPDGSWEAYFDAPPGALSLQVLFDGAPVSEGRVAVEPPGRVHVVVDENGNVVTAESVEPAQLTVTKTDEQGNPLPGDNCFAVYAGDKVASQRCDPNDGQTDGVTTLMFPNGIPSGRLTLAETLTDPSQQPVEDQRIRLRPGDNEVTVSTGGGPGPAETPTSGPTPGAVSVTFVAVDEQGEVITGNPACYTIDGGPEHCDDDGDGAVTFQVDPGSHTVTETQDPQGYQGIGSADFEVQEDSTFQVPHTATAQPAETPTEEVAQPGVIVAYVVDADTGEELPLACFDVSQFGQLCDGDDPDARMTQTDVPPGNYQVAVVAASLPSGYEVVGDAQAEVTVQPGETVEVAFRARRAAPAEGRLGIRARDDQGGRVADACFVVSGEAGTSDEICTAANGNVGINVPPGDYTVTATRWPEGVEPEQTEQTATVQSGETTTVTFRFRTAGPQTGTLVAYVVDAETGDEIPNTCFNVSGLGQLCDGNDADARMTQTDVPTGDYEVAVDAASLPEGYQIAGSDQITVTVEPGGTAEAVFQAQRVAPQTGSLRISVVDDNGQPVAGACVDVSGPASGTVCDNDEADQDQSDGQILVTDIPPGSYSVSVPAPPEGFQASSVEQATVQPGEEASVTVTVPAGTNDGDAHHQQGGRGRESARWVVLQRRQLDGLR